MPEVRVTISEEIAAALSGVYAGNLPYGCAKELENALPRLRDIIAYTSAQKAVKAWAVIKPETKAIVEAELATAIAAEAAAKIEAEEKPVEGEVIKG